ncbi:MAG: hypothetical protein QMD65_01885 [Patescibacteria group bacterium]|nr:hypothetical protein [Patescibacteria group bacterium]
MIKASKKEAINKPELLMLVVEELKKAKNELEKSAKKVKQEIRNAPSPMQSHSDKTRFELSSIYRNSASLIEGYNNAINKLNKFPMPKSSVDSKINLGSLIEVGENKSEHKYYFLLSVGKTVKFKYAGSICIVITPQTPLGEALIGKKQGDVFEFGNRKTKIIKVI